MFHDDDPYRRLADVYDTMASDRAIQAFYGEWRRRLLDAARAHSVRPRVLVDLACGTGNSTIPWTRRRGWTVVGVDRSAAMLRVARRKSSRVRWHCQDLRHLALDVRADLVTCHGDALNHVFSARDLQRVFANVRRVLRDGGLFQFDLNTEHWLRWLAGREKLCRANGHYFVATNALDARTGIATFRQTWFVHKGRGYEKREITVRERAYRQAEVRRMLRKAGMRVLTVETQRAIAGKAIRVVYLAQAIAH